MVYETNIKKGTFDKIQKNDFYILKCRAINALSYFDNSGDSPSTSYYVEYEYYGGKCRFTWLLSVSSSSVELEKECYVLLIKKRNDKYMPMSFYLIDPERGYTELAEDIAGCYVDEPLCIIKKYGYPKYNNDGLNQIKNITR